MSRTKQAAEAAPRTITSLEDAVDAGFLGTEVDTTPNHAYTLAGVTGSAGGKKPAAAKADTAATAAKEDEKP